MALVLPQPHNANPFESLFCGTLHKPISIEKPVFPVGLDPLDLLLSQVPKPRKQNKQKNKKKSQRKQVTIPNPEFVDSEIAIGEVICDQISGQERLEKLFERKSKYYQNMRKVEQVYSTAHIKFCATMQCHDKILYDIDISQPPFDDNPNATPGQRYSFSILEIRDVDGNIIRHPQIVGSSSGDWMGEYIKALTESLPKYIGGDFNRHECMLTTPRGVYISCIDNTCDGTGKYDFNNR